MTEKNKAITIECDCGTHMLKIEYDQDDDYPSLYLAMFYYGINSHKRGLLGRIVIAWKYLRTGKMHADQLILNPEEAKKLSDFIIQWQKQNAGTGKAVY